MDRMTIVFPINRGPSVIAKRSLFPGLHVVAENTNRLELFSCPICFTYKAYENIEILKGLRGRIAIYGGGGTIPMRAAVIPWHVFVEALKNQRPEGSELWLRRWRFEDSGVWVGARIGASEMAERADRESDRENFPENPCLSKFQLTAVGCKAHVHSPKAARKMAVTRQRMPVQPVNLRRSTEQVS
jgi:hypothetical protein